VTGMHHGGVLVAVKHYPGLGRVRGNTDFVTKVVDRVTTRHDRRLKGFAAGTRAGVDMVMVSSAYYTKIDARRRAVFSPVVLKSMLRSDLRYPGVIVSDDLNAPGFRQYTPGKRAVTFLAAGGDLMIVGDSSRASTMASAVRARAASDPAFRAELTRKVTRVLQMKARRGLATCR
jgi:beta-N-acetylhexosaminidase